MKNQDYQICQYSWGLYNTYVVFLNNISLEYPTRNYMIEVLKSKGYDCYSVINVPAM